MRACARVPRMTKTATTHVALGSIVLGLVGLVGLLGAYLPFQFHCRQVCPATAGEASSIKQEGASMDGRDSSKGGRSSQRLTKHQTTMARWTAATYLGTQLRLNPAALPESKKSSHPLVPPRRRARASGPVTACMWPPAPTLQTGDALFCSTRPDDQTLHVSISLCALFSNGRRGPGSAFMWHLSPCVGPTNGNGEELTS